MADLTSDASEATFRLEVVVLPVTDVDRARAFYSEGMGFRVDVDHSAGEDFRVVQLTPPGSSCSVTLMRQPDRAGAVQGLHLVVRDIEVARDELVSRGVDCSDYFHFTEAGQTPGLHPDRADYGTFVSIEDPDGNGWLLQELGRGVGTGRINDPDRAGRNAGHAFARALESKDWSALTALFADEVDVKGLTPGRHWDATTPQSVVADILTNWFEDSDHIDHIDDVRTRPHLGRFHLSYRAHVTHDDGRYLVEQQAYYDVDDDGRIKRMSLLCAGYRPADD